MQADSIVTGMFNFMQGLLNFDQGDAEM